MFVVNSYRSGAGCKRILCESTMSPCCCSTAYLTHTDCICTVNGGCVKQALLISRGLNISSIIIKDVALSDHFCVFFDILISVTTESRSVSVRKRCINENTSVQYMEAISVGSQA